MEERNSRIERDRALPTGLDTDLDRLVVHDVGGHLGDARGRAVGEVGLAELRAEEVGVDLCDLYI